MHDRSLKYGYSTNQVIAIIKFTFSSPVASIVNPEDVDQLVGLNTQSGAERGNRLQATIQNSVDSIPA